ncbi:phage tail assembly chaperone [Collimonas humicola]|uniref:phage tail assembly chaperone n=1 Tax=Collimonas humicola TaxID=2825886 RepID=UPI001B8AD994|nr:hypothetical protein [Collimonas humicola]
MVARAGGSGNRKSGKFHQGLIADLLAFAKGEFTLDERQSDGATLRQHIAIVAKQSGKIPEEYVFPDCPEQLRYLWQLFIDFCESRCNTGYGILPLQYAEIEAWSRLMRCPLTPWEVSVIKRIDGAFMQAQMKEKKA